jgi:hypothetical protein
VLRYLFGLRGTALVDGLVPLEETAAVEAQLGVLHGAP